MSTRNFRELLDDRWAEGKFVCVGLDIDYQRVPNSLVLGNSLKGALVAFAKSVIDATHDIVCAYKPNYAFYEAYGADGIAALYIIVDYIHRVAPNVLVILDGKRLDIGNSNKFTAAGIFDGLGADALTIHNYLGATAAKDFLDRTDKGIFVLCRTSNDDAGEFQDLIIDVPDHGFNEIYQGVLVSNDGFAMPKRMPLYQYVAYRVKYVWNRKRGNLGLVTGATYPEEIGHVRSIATDLPFLIPGIGTQGGDLEAAVRNGRAKDGTGFIINSSSGIIFASSDKDYAQVARDKTLQLDGAIRACLGKESIDDS